MALPDIAEVREKLKLGAAIADEFLQHVLDSEIALQADECVYDVDDYPAPLRQALYRRVNRALELENQPLGLITGAGDGQTGVSRVDGTDREIRRLEAKYRVHSDRIF